MKRAARHVKASCFWALPALAVVALGGVTSVVSAQSPPAPLTAPAPAAGVPAGAGGAGWSGGTIAIVVLVLAAIAVIVVIAKLNDLRKKREDQAVQLQSQISDALLRDRSVGVSVTPTVQVPFWKGSPARIELHGEVPSAPTRQAALRIAAQEASRVRPDFEISDRIAEVPVPAVRAA